MTSGTLAAAAQIRADNVDQVYGLDPLLYNGRVYGFFPQPGTGGTQFITKEFDQYGSIKVRGVSYANLMLNYDIFNQQVVMKYKAAIGSPGLIELSYAWLETFELNNCHFERIAETDTTSRIYQVLGTGSDKILCYFSKDLLLDNMKASRNRYFSETRRQLFVSSQGKKIGFKNNRSFIKTFDTNKQDRIKTFMRSNKINVKSAGDNTLKALINYCSSLS